SMLRSPLHFLSVHNHGDFMRTRVFGLLIIIPFLASFSLAQSRLQLNLMPMPASVQPGSGQLSITAWFSVEVSGARDASLDREVQRFQSQLSRQTGIPFRPKAGVTPTLTIHADHGREAVQKLGEDESYELKVSDSGAQLNAPTTLGAIRGLQT